MWSIFIVEHYKMLINTQLQWEVLTFHLTFKSRQTAITTFFEEHAHMRKPFRDPDATKIYLRNLRAKAGVLWAGIWVSLLHFLTSFCVKAKVLSIYFSRGIFLWSHLYTAFIFGFFTTQLYNFTTLLVTDNFLGILSLNT